MATHTTTHESVPLAILFADISGSTKLYETMGNTKAQKIVDQCLAMLRDVVNGLDGNVVKTIGDEIMCTFTAAETAARAAGEMQKALKLALSFGKFEVSNLSIRIGFHHGPVIAAGGDVFGDAVNVAARVTAQAKAQQILTTKETLGQMPTEVQSRSRFVDRVGVKGKSEDLELYEVLWEFDNLTLVEDSFRGPQAQSSKIVLNYNGVEMELSKSRPSLRFGRGTENDFVVPDHQASRLHARIELRRDRFVLVDQSMNGTYVQMEGVPEVCLRRDEVPLKGTGLISLGRATASEAAIHIKFTCL
jgi:class 3 adenylate cyclase